jgi:hypothetical protein
MPSSQPAEAKMPKSVLRSLAPNRRPLTRSIRPGPRCASWIAGVVRQAPPHAAAAPPALCTAVASKNNDVPEQQRAFAINPVLEQSTRSFRKVMGTLYRDRRDFLGVVVVVERRGDKEGGFGSVNERSRLRAMAAAAARPRAPKVVKKTETTEHLPRLILAWLY